jgi:hypothetical protein
MGKVRNCYLVTFFISARYLDMLNIKFGAVGVEAALRYHQNEAYPAPQHWHWQSAVHWRDVCQGVIVILENHRMGERDLAIVKSSPAILLRKLQCFDHR